jgi:hypothetical protein
MKLLGAEELLDAWEAGLNRPPLRRALILLTAALPGASAETVEAMTVGERDQHLLRLREDLFGQRMQNMAECPECGERVEWESRTRELLAAAESPALAADSFEMQSGDCTLRFRLPTSLDLLTVIDDDTGDSSERLLLARCVLEAHRAGTPCDFDDIPDEALGALGSRLESLDPLADLRMELCCPGCDHEWILVFDIAGFLCEEVDHWAGRMLRTVSELAASFGWSEREILRISPLRRQLYLGMLR